jgi:hypothetical protein
MKKLAVPYLSQIDNNLNPYGSCNVTSLAMCMKFLGITNELDNNNKHYGKKQIEDNLYLYAQDMGYSRHSPYDLEQITRDLGYEDTFTPYAKWGDVKEWIDKGLPCVVHGYFTSFGHIIVIVGYDQKNKQWIVHDPYGEYYASGYECNSWENPNRGKDQKYSYGMMKELCGPDGDLWIHYIGLDTDFGGLRLQDIYEDNLEISLSELPKHKGLIKQMKIRLKAIGFDTGDVGPGITDRFNNAVKTFAKHYKLEVIIDKEFAKKLIESKEIL